MKENKAMIDTRWLDSITISDEYSLGRSEGQGWRLCKDPIACLLL